MNRSLAGESGYSMVEVLAAIVILTAAILPMIGMFDAGLRAVSTSGNYDEARALANANLEAAKANPDTSEATGGPCPIEGEGAVDDDGCMVDSEPVYVDPDSGSPSFETETTDDGDLEMTKITVTVEWGPDDREYSVSGIVAR